MSSEYYLCIILITLLSCLTVTYFMLHEDEGFKRIYTRVYELQTNKTLGLSWLAVILFLLGVIVYQGYYYIAGTLFFYMSLYRLFYYCGKKGNKNVKYK